MNWLRNMPLKRGLTLVIVLTCSVVLLIACSILVAYEIDHFSQLMVRNTTVLANVLAENTRAALAFQDEVSAHQTLLALRSEPAVTGACLYNAGGIRFAEYTREGGVVGFPVHAGPDGHRFEHDHLALYRPIILDGKRIGTIYLETELRGLYDQLRIFGEIALLVLFGSCVVAIALAPALQRPVSGPLLAMTEAIQHIATDKNYAVRIPPQGQNETGQLTNAFNQFLSSIEERDTALSAEINHRKQAEDKVRAQLARLELLHHITRATGERQDLKSIFQVVIRTLEKHLPIDFSCICLYDENASTLTVTSVGVHSESLAVELAMAEQARVDIDQNGLSECVRGRLVYEPEIDGLPYAFPQRLARGGMRSMVAAPLLVESKVFGVLISARRQPNGFNSGECEFLRQLTEHVALAAHHAQLFEALQQAYEDLHQSQQAAMQQERLKALGQMASGIAHDINNAISPVMLYTEWLQENELNLSERARGHLETIQRAMEDVAHTVARMREFYRQSEQQLTFAPVKLNQLARQVVDLTRARWSDMPQQRGVFIRAEAQLAPELPPILGVESEIREALVNLIFNAVDAMPEGGTLTLRTGVSRDHSQLVHVEVSDTGIGMDEDTRRRCLEPFFTTKGERGTGLGLAMVYGIARRHNADIEISSTPGLGTTIRLNFAIQAAPADDGGTASTVFTVPQRLRLLIIDDDPLLIRSLHDTMETDGHLIVTANGGQEGIDTFRKAIESEQRFTAVITDLGMPYVDGRQVASAVKSLSPSTPVILLTGWGQRLVAEDDIPPHVDRVLNKPPRLRDLREALVECLRAAES